MHQLLSPCNISHITLCFINQRMRYLIASLCLLLPFNISCELALKELLDYAEGNIANPRFLLYGKLWYATHTLYNVRFFHEDLVKKYKEKDDTVELDRVNDAGRIPAIQTLTRLFPSPA